MLFCTVSFYKGDQRVPRQNGNRYRDDNRPGNSGMNEGMRGRGRGYYGNNQDRRQYAYPGGERRPDEAGENGRKDGELDYRPEKERGGTSGDRYNGRENRPSYGTKLRSELNICGERMIFLLSSV